MSQLRKALKKLSQEELTALLKYFVQTTRGDKPWTDADLEWIEQEQSNLHFETIYLDDRPLLLNEEEEEILKALSDWTGTSSGFVQDIEVNKSQVVIDSYIALLDNKGVFEWYTPETGHFSLRSEIIEHFRTKGLNDPFLPTETN